MNLLSRALDNRNERPRIRLSIDTHKVSCALLGLLTTFVGGLLLAVAMVEGILALMIAASVPLGLGLWLHQSTSYVIRQPASAVKKQVERTLVLMSVRYSREDDYLTIQATGTRVRARALGVCALMTFDFAEGGSGREEYLRKTLVKFLRYIS